MTVVRWGRGTLEGTTTTTGKVRWGRGTLEGTAATTPKVRWGRGTLEGAAGIVIGPIAAQTVEPGTSVEVPATVVTGSWDQMAWRRVSGPTVQLVASGPSSVTFIAPSVMPPSNATVVLGVFASMTGVGVSTEQTATITVRPQIRWSLEGGVWVGQRPAVAPSAAIPDPIVDAITDEI